MDDIQRAKDILSQFMADKRMRKTPERFHLLEAVYTYHGHFTADELYEKMQKSFRISRATVYSALDLFVKAGLVVKNILGNTIEYEKCLGMKSHCHMVCTVCGSIKEFTNSRIEHDIESAKYSKFIKQNFSVNVFGICYKCQAKLNRQRRMNRVEEDTTIQTNKKMKK